ncbi:MAG: Helix-turn-helix domain [Solirubrobacteraceae bacterium]
MARRLEPQKALGRAIRQMREEHGLKQGDIAKKANVNLTHFSRLEHGRVNPSWGTLRRVAAALGVPVSEVAARAEQIEREG